MALIKEYMTSKGPASYWVLGLLQIDNFNKTAYARLYGFYNKEQADKLNPVPITTLEVNLTPDWYDYYFNEEILKIENASPLTQAYVVFKDSNVRNEQGEIFDFSDAEDEINGVVVES
jgi:hypothetical protein